MFSTNNDVINGIVKPIAQPSTIEISIFELSYIKNFLNALVSLPLNDEANLEYLKVCKMYDGIVHRLNKRNGIHSNTEKEKAHLRDIIDNTLDDLEVIYKDTGLDSVGNLINHIKNAKNEGVQ